MRWFWRKEKTLAERREICLDYGHQATDWDGYWATCRRCGQRFIP